MGCGSEVFIGLCLAIRAAHLAARAPPTVRVCYEDPARTLLTHEIARAPLGDIGLMRKGRPSPGLVAASSDELEAHSRKPQPDLHRSRYKETRATSCRRARASARTSRAAASASPVATPARAGAAAGWW